MPTVRLKNVSPLGDIELPAIGRVGDNYLKAGEEFDCPEELAGVAPGTWREPTAEELADRLAGLQRRVQGGRVEVLCPGWGLLAQTDNFVPVKVSSPTMRNASSASAATSEEK